MSHQIKILLIDDDPDFARLVTHWLSRKSASFLVQWSPSINDALMQLGRGRHDVILLDLGLPDGGGMDTFARVTRASGGTPLILLSGDSSESLTLKLAGRGVAEEYIVYKSTANSNSLETAIQCAAGRSM